MANDNTDLTSELGTQEQCVSFLPSLTFKNISDFPASWDNLYSRENANFADNGDIGEIWFGKDSAKKMVNWVRISTTCTSFYCFFYSMYLTGAGGVTNTNVGLGLALFYGGFIQFLAGILEMIRGDIFHGTAFSSYGKELCIY